MKKKITKKNQKNNFMTSKILFIKRGFFKTCPQCGKSNLYSSYLNIIPRCKNKKCKLTFEKYRTDDGPAYFTIFIIGHVVIPLIVFLEGLETPPSFIFQITFWPIFTILLGIWLLPRIKGAFLGFQISVNDSSS